MMTMIARAKGPEAIPASTEAPPKRESRPPAAATIAIIATPTGLLGFGAEECIKSRLLVGMISLLDKLVARRLRITAWSQRASCLCRRYCLRSRFSRGFAGVVASNFQGLDVCWRRLLDDKWACQVLKRIPLERMP